MAYAKLYYPLPNVSVRRKRTYRRPISRKRPRIFSDYIYPIAKDIAISAISSYIFSGGNPYAAVTSAGSALVEDIYRGPRIQEVYGGVPKRKFSEVIPYPAKRRVPWYAKGKWKARY